MAPGPSTEAVTTSGSVTSLIPVPVRTKSINSSSTSGGDSPKSEGSGSSVDSGFVQPRKDAKSGDNDEDKTKGRHNFVRTIDRAKIERRQTLTHHTKIPLRVERSNSFSTTAERNFQSKCIQRRIVGYFHQHYHQPEESTPELGIGNTGSSQLWRDKSSFGGSDSVYFNDLLQNEFEKEHKYGLMFKLKKPKEHIHVQLRRKIVEWMISASTSFKYSVNTIHVAVFFMDVMVQVIDMKVVAWPLLGLTALHLAAKMEEPRFAKLQLIWAKYKNLAKFGKYEVTWMEQHLLKFLGFSLNPPTAKFFTDIGFESGEIGFPSLDIVRLVKHLTDTILMNSLLEYDLTFIKSSIKAILAMRIVTQHVLLNSERLLPAMAFAEQSGELKNACRICYSHFLKTVQTQHYFAQDDCAV